MGEPRRSLISEGNDLCNTAGAQFWRATGYTDYCLTLELLPEHKSAGAGPEASAGARAGESQRAKGHQSTRLLDWLVGKSGPAFTERIWSTTARKLEDLVSQVQHCQALGIQPVRVAHFRATQQRLLDAFDLETIRSRPIEFTCCTGLDEPCLVPFGIEWMRQLIARLGMDEATVLRLTLMTPLI